jgi:hypothetical protein
VYGSAEPEVLVETHWGGAHCCFQTAVASRGKAGYRWVKRTWGDIRYRGQWRRGVFYFLSHDRAFSGAFASSADSTWPAQVWTLTSSGRMRNTTRERLDYVQANATRQWGWYAESRRAQEGSVRGILAAWCANQYLLGAAEACDAELERAASAGWLETRFDDASSSAGDYIAKLRRFLREHGYRR